MKTTPIVNALRARKDRSCWSKAVTEDAIQLLENVEYIDAFGGMPMSGFYPFRRVLLNGADNWSHYSWSGCALCYNSDIAKHYCTPSKFKRTRGGAFRPNTHEEWLDVQARALSQACRLAWQTACDLEA